MFPRILFLTIVGSFLLVSPAKSQCLMGIGPLCLTGGTGGCVAESLRIFCSVCRMVEDLRDSDLLASCGRSEGFAEAERAFGRGFACDGSGRTSCGCDKRPCGPSYPELDNKYRLPLTASNRETPASDNFDGEEDEEVNSEGAETAPSEFTQFDSQPHSVSTPEPEQDKGGWSDPVVELHRRIDMLREEVRISLVSLRSANDELESGDAEHGGYNEFVRKRRTRVIERLLRLKARASEVKELVESRAGEVGYPMLADGIRDLEQVLDAEGIEADSAD